jgi:hypothetical protein
MKPNFGELSTKMIELFREGKKIVIENNDLKVLRSIFKQIDPEFKISGEWKYYWFHTGDLEFGKTCKIKDLPIYKATDFIIPKKFAIKIDDENRSEVKRIAYACGVDKNIDGTLLSFESKYPYYHFNNGKYVPRSYHDSEYKELTFDHFKLLFDCGVEKEIEGYLAPMDLFGGLVRAGTVYNFEEHTKDLYYPTTWRGSKGLPKEIVETWEPVFKSKEVIIQVGACKIPVHIIPGKRIFAKHGWKEIDLHPESLKKCVKDRLVHVMDNSKVHVKISDANFDVTFNNSTLKDVTLEEINKVITAYGK